MPAPIVHFDIAAPDNAKQQAFYAKVFGWSVGPGGTMAIPVNGSTLSGALRPDPADKVIYIGVADITATLKDVDANGGKLDTPRFEVKSVAVIGLFRDPAGNRMGLVELTSEGKVKIP